MNVPWRPRPSKLNAVDTQRDYRLNGNTIFIGHGDDNRSELAFTFALEYTPNNLKLCNAINQLVGMDEDVSNDANYNFFTYFGWTGSYSDGGTDATRIIGDTLAEEVFVGKQTGCFHTGRNGDRYIFYHILIPR